KRSDVGKHTYTVSEKIPDKAVEKKDAQGNTYYEKDGIRYSSQTYTVTVDVKDNGDGSLNVEASENANALNFTNTYGAAGSVQFAGTKTITNKPADMSLAGYIFKIVDKDSKETVATASSDADGKIAYPVINYTLADAGKSFTYVVSEENAGKTIGGVTYDSNSYEVTVKVEDNK
ncbi:Spy0128 family protein, partial [Bilifractor sp. LCP21S3_A7]|uniref:Spy0128 family protein n=1 Tax=Bilifractor sp. LCP21S3_A7 TaxID=3438738 RepID=UPI003F906A4E